MNGFKPNRFPKSNELPRRGSNESVLTELEQAKQLACKTLAMQLKAFDSVGKAEKKMKNVIYKNVNMQDFNIIKSEWKETYIVWLIL